MTRSNRSHHGARNSRRAFLGAAACVLLGASVSQGQTARPAPVWSVQFSPDGKTLAAGAYKEVRLFDVAGKSLLRSLSGHSGPVRCLAWSADGTQLAAGGGLPGELGEVKVWKAPFDGTGPAKPSAEMKEHKDVVEGVAFSPAGDAVITASDDEKALAVGLEDRKVVARMQDHNNRVVAVAVSPSGKFLATGSLDKTVKIWSGKDYKPLANLDNTGGQVYALAFLPQDTLAVAGEDGNLRLFRLQESRTGSLSSVSSNLVRTFGGNRTAILALAFGAKGNWLVSGGEDKTINVYDVNSGNRKYQLKESPEAVYSLAVSPDGALIAAGCRDGKVRLWTTADGKPAGEL